MVLAISHLLLVTNGAVIGGAREFTSVVSEVCVARAFIFCVTILDYCLPFCPFFFHYSPSSIYCL